MKTKRSRILLTLCLFVLFALPLIGVQMQRASVDSGTFTDFSIAERYAVNIDGSRIESGGMQPTIQGTDYGTGNTRWEIVGFSLMYGGSTTIMGDNQGGFFTNDTLNTRYYGTSPSIKKLAGNERVYESSIYTKLAGSTTYQWHNIRFRITPANFENLAPEFGRSLYDNLLLELATTSRPAMKSKMAVGGTGWLNGIMSAKSSSTSAHTAVKSGMLYKDRGSAYTYPIRTFITYNKWKASASWPTTSLDTVRLYFEIRFLGPIIEEFDDIAPSISLSPMNNSSYVKSQGVTITASDTGGSGLASLVYQTRTNSGAWSGATAIGSGGTITFNNTGYNEIWGTARDGRGNTKTVHGYYYYTDNTVPNVVSSSLTGAQYENGNDKWFAAGRTFTFDNTGHDGHAGIRNQYIRLAGPTDIRAHHDWFSATVNYFNPWITGNGAVLTGVTRSTNSGGNRRLLWTGTTQAYDYDFDVQYYYGDAAGNNVGYNNTGLKLRIDASAPSAPSISVSPAGWTNGNASVTIGHGSDSRSGVNRSQYKIGSGAWTNYTGAFTVSTAGQTIIYARTIDNVGNISANASRYVYIDKTAPTGTTTISPSGWTNGNVTITLSTSDTGGSGYYRTRLPNGTYSTSASPSYVVTSNGTYSFTIYDNAGNSTVVSRTVSNIDKTAPTGTTTISPSGWTNGNVTITLSTSDTGGSGYYRTRLPNGTYSTNASPTYAVSGNGTYSFVIYDHAGNSRTVSRTISNVDKTAPTGTTTISPSGWTNGNVTITLSTSDTGGSGYYRTRLPNGTYSTSASPSYVVTSNGTYSFTIYDNAGNSTVVSRTVSNIDKIAPTGTITPSTTGWTNGNVTITLSTSDTGGSGYYRTRLPNGTYSTSASPSYVVTSNGTYSFTIYDNAGNSTVVSRTVSNIDKIAPTGAITPSTTGWTNGNVILTLSTSDTGGSGYYRTRLPNGTYSTSASPTYTATSNGMYSFVIYDNAGNSRTVSIAITNIDKVLPNHVSVSIAGYSYRNGNDYWVRGGASFTYTHRGTDALSGLQYVYSRIAGGTTDARTQHSLTAVANHNNHWDTDPYITYVSATRTYYDGKTGEVRWGMTVTNAERDYDMQVYYRDKAGNSVGYSDTGLNVRVDNTAPSMPAVILSPSGWTSGNVSVSIFNGSDSRSGVNRTEYRINGGSWMTYMGPFTATAVGTNIQARTIDNVGHISAISSSTVNIDRTAPGAPTINRSRTGWGNAPGTFTLTHGADAHSGTAYSQYRIGSGAWINYGGTVTVSPNGPNAIYARTIDNVGNISAVTSTTMYNDFTPPTVSASPSSSDWVNDGVTVTLNYADSFSGINTRQYRWTTSTTIPTSWSTYSTPVSQTGQGIWYLHYRAIDNVGNVRTGYFGPYRVKREDGLSVKNTKVTPNTVHLEPNKTSITRAISVSFSVENRIFPNHGNPINPSVTIRYGTVTLWTGKVQVPANGATTRTLLFNNVFITPGRSIIVEVNGDRLFAEYHYSGLNPYADNVQSVPILAKPHISATACELVNPALPYTVNDRNIWRETWTKTTQTATLSGDYFINSNRVTSSTIEEYEETFKILSVEFKSKYTYDNRMKFGYIDFNGWQTINKPGFPESNIAKIKAGYGFELRTVVEYRTNRHVIPAGYTESFSDYVNSSTYGQGYANYTVVSPSFIPVQLPTAIYFDIDGHNTCYQLVPVTGENITETSQWQTIRKTYEIENKTTFGFAGDERKIYIPTDAKPNTHTVTVRTPYNQDTAFKGYTEETLVTPTTKTFLRDMLEFELEILGQDDIKSHFGN